MLNVHKVKYLVKIFGNNQNKQFYLKEVHVSITAMYFYVLELLFSAIFIYACYNSIEKYIDSKVAVAIQESEISDVEYPSVRKCFKYKYIWQRHILHCTYDGHNFEKINIVSILYILKSISVSVWIMSTSIVLTNFCSKMIPLLLMPLRILWRITPGRKTRHFSL